MDNPGSSGAGDWNKAVAGASGALQLRGGSHLDRLLGAMERDIADSFTEAQIQALEGVLAASSSRRLPIDIRLTVPFFRRHFFITLLAGRERRSAARLKQERRRHRLWTLANACCIVFVLSLSVPAVVGLVHLLALAR